MNFITKTFTVGDLITLMFGGVGITAAFFAFTSDTKLNAQDIQRIDDKLLAVERRTDKRVTDVKSVIRESEQRLQAQIRNVDNKLDQLLLQRR